MSGIFNLGQASSGGSAIEALTVDGNGPVYHKDGALWGQPYIAVHPLRMEHPDGIDGAPILSITPPNLIAVARGIDGQSLADQPFQVSGGQEFFIERVVFCHSSGAAGALTGGLFALPDRAGVPIVAASTALAALDGTRFASLSITPAFMLRASAWLYFRADVAATAPMTFDIYVHGSVQIGQENTPVI